MTEITLTTPALLFPAISLLLLAYTNRFLTLAGLIRRLHADYRDQPSGAVLGQIKNLRTRVGLIKNMLETLENQWKSTERGDRTEEDRPTRSMAKQQ